MRNQEPCAEWAEKLVASHKEELPASDRAALHEHLRTCVTCSNALKDYEVIESLIQTVANREVMPPLTPRLLHLRDQIAEQHNIDKQRMVESEPIQLYFRDLEQMIRAISLLDLQKVLAILEEAYHNGHRIFVIGNGGSAATASHFALDLAKNTIVPGAPRVKAISLTDHVPLITAWSNDTHYEHIFAEQLANMIEPGDVVIGISTSGNSTNIINAVKLAWQKRATTIGLLGEKGGKLKDMVDACVLAPGQNIEQEEDAHMILAHIITRHMRQVAQSYSQSSALLEEKEASFRSYG